MKYIKYLLFELICLFSFNIVFAANEITVDSMIPVYDENSGVIVTEENGEHSVIFNDKDQSVKYNVVLKNNTNKDIPIDNLTLPTPTEDFLKYELTGLNSGDVIKANSTKDVVISLETVKTEGWGRNFDIDLTTAVNLDSSVLNPNTSTKDLLIILGLAILFTGVIVILLKHKKVVRYGILIIGFFSVVPYINADKEYIIPIKINVSFESKNVMKKSYTLDKYGNRISTDYWQYGWRIRNFYIENEFREIAEYSFKFDVSEKQNERVIAYLVKTGTASNPDDSWDPYTEYDVYDLYLQADGKIYPNVDASYYFSGMTFLGVINNLEGLDTSNVTNMSYMFRNMGSRSDNLILDLSKFDTSRVTDMSHMFENTGRNSGTIDLDLSSFNTSNVTNMSGMFRDIGYFVDNVPIDVGNFDTSRVTDMSGMFASTGGNSKNLILDLSNFDTSNVTNMSGMFSYAGINSEKVVINVNSFDTGNVTDMRAMFHQTAAFCPDFTLDVSNFDTSNVVDMREMFTQIGYNHAIKTSITIMNPNTTSYYNMFSQAAQHSNSKIVVNYTSETSDLVDEMIAIKSSNSNVVKGVQVD